MKDHQTFLKAASLLREKKAGVQFVCVGTGPESYWRRLKQQAGELKIAHIVLWAGARDDMVAIYNALDLLVSASYGEGLPNAIGEAMSCGVPCVVTDVGDSALLAGECGIVVPPSNPAALAAGMLRSLNDDRETIGKKSREQIVNVFSIQKAAQQAEETILRVANVK